MQLQGLWVCSYACIVNAHIPTKLVALELLMLSETCSAVPAFFCGCGDLKCPIFNHNVSSNYSRILLHSTCMQTQPRQSSNSNHHPQRSLLTLKLCGLQLSVCPCESIFDM